MIVTHTHRGVTYGARVVETQCKHGPDYYVDLTADGKPVARAEISVRLYSSVPLGGDEKTATAIYEALQRALKAALARDP